MLAAVLTLLVPARGASVQEVAQRLQRAKAGAGVVRILHFGDSHLAAPATSSAYGAFFRGSYGDGGPGLGLPWVSPMEAVRAEASRGWRKAGWKDGDRRLGLGAASFEAKRAGEWARLEGRFSRLRLYFLQQPGGGQVRISLDGATLETLDLSVGGGSVRVFEHAAGGPLRVHRLELSTQSSGPVRLLDVALEGSSGAVHSTLAFNGAAASWLTETPEGLFAAELQAEDPDLVMLAFGTNEANASDFTAPLYQVMLEAVLARFQKAAPGAGFVLLGPPDAALKRGLPQALEQVIQVQRAVAARVGALFVDRRQAMGGAGSIDAWLGEGLAAKDRVHLTGPGYTRLARATLTDLWSQLGQEARFPSAPPAAHLPAPPAPAAAPPAQPKGSTIYVFRTTEGRIFIVDDPRKVAGLEGEWIQGKP